MGESSTSSKHIGLNVSWPLAIAAITYFETEEDSVSEVLSPLLQSHPHISEGLATNVFRAMLQGKNPITSFEKIADQDREQLQGFVSAIREKKEQLRQRIERERQ